MYSIERKAEIIKFLEQDGTIEVSAMADYFDTSKKRSDGIWKDLEAQGILTRTHGGAVSTHIKPAKRWHPGISGSNSRHPELRIKTGYLQICGFFH